MKKGFFTLAALLGVFSLAQAQTERGRWLIGTQVGGGTYKDQNQFRSLSASLAPSAGYFIAKNLLIGVSIPVSLDKSRSYRYLYPSPTPAAINVTSIAYGLGPFARYYIGEGKLKPYLGVSSTYGRNSLKTEENSLLARQKGYYTQISPTAGVSYFISRIVALNAGLSYDISRYKYNSSGPVISNPGAYNYGSRSFTLDIGFQILFGR